MRRFILTRTPGSGKTALIRQLELEGFGVVATDVIAAAVKGWTGFVAFPPSRQRQQRREDGTPSCVVERARA